jgi:hypothetical protein
VAQKPAWGEVPSGPSKGLMAIGPSPKSRFLFNRRFKYRATLPAPLGRDRGEGLGFRAPVSARFFPGEGRLVRLLPETGSGLTAAVYSLGRLFCLSVTLAGSRRERVAKGTVSPKHHDNAPSSA